MACVEFLSLDVEDPGVSTATIFHPGSITPDGSFVYGQGAGIDNNKIQKYTWPGLVFDSTYVTLSGVTLLGYDVIVDGDGNVYHSRNPIGSTETQFYKNGSLLASITLAGPGRTGGGLAWAEGFLWTLMSQTSGYGALWRINPTTGAVTEMFFISSPLAIRPYAATDGSLWFTRTTGSFVYRHLNGVTNVATLVAAAAFIPRPNGVMLGTSTANAWKDFSPAMAMTDAVCNPSTIAGAFAPPRRSFSNHDLTKVAMSDSISSIYVFPYGSIPWLRQRQRDDFARVSVTAGRNNPTSLQANTLRQGKALKNNYF
jgi:hypothetical protein